MSGFVAFRPFAAWNSRVVAGRVRPGTVLPLLPGFALQTAITWPSGLTSFVRARVSACVQPDRRYSGITGVCVCVCVCVFV